MFSVKCLVVVAKCLKWIFFMAPSIVVLGIQIQSVKMKILKLITKSIAQKVVIKFGFGCRH